MLLCNKFQTSNKATVTKNEIAYKENTVHTSKQYHYSITNDRSYVCNLLKLGQGYKIPKNIHPKYLVSCRHHVVMCLAITKLVTLTTLCISVHNS